ncbi:MAG: PAS domain-containing protein [Eubacteriales bacterium]|nr:PAS domain-containing protein [Eubacteriales bacterium]
MAIVEAIRNSADYLPVNTVVYRVQDGKLERLYYSSGIPALSGYTQEEFTQLERENAMGLLLPSDQALVARKLRECVEKQTGANFVYRLSHKTKGYIWVHAVTRYIGLVEGFPVIVANLINISNEMMTNSVILDSSDRSIALIDQETRDVLYANQSFLDMTETTLDECIGRPCNEVVCKMGAWTEDNCVCLKMQSTGESQLCPGPRGRIYSMSCTPVKIGEHKALAFFMTDVTENERNRRRVEQLQADMVARYRQQVNTIMRMNPDALSTFQINLTGDTCGNGVSAFPNLLCLQDKGTVDGYFEDALRYIPAADHIQRAPLTRERLLAAFHAGQAAVSIDCHYLLAENDERLIRTTLAMMENPITHDV